MKFSLIIPVYNRAKTIHEAIASVESQNYEDIEIICVDDGSSDDSYDTLLDLQKKSRFRKGTKSDDGDFLVLQHTEINEETNQEIPKNKGTNMALNTGFNAASGDIIGILDSDDMLAPFTIDAIVRAYKEEPLLDVCWTLYEAMEPGWKYPRLGSRCSWPAPQTQKDVILQNLIRFSCFHFLTVRTSSYRGKFASFENMPSTSVDYAWVLENMFRGEFRRLNHVGYYYQTKSENSHSGEGKSEQQRIATICRLNALNYAHEKGFINDEDVAQIKERCAELKENYEEKKLEKERLIKEGKIKEEEMRLLE